MSQVKDYDVTISHSGIVWFPDIKELITYRDMLFFLILRDFKIRFKQSFLGVLWVFLQPILSTIVFTSIVGGALNVSFEAPYAISFLSALMAWNYFSKVMTNGVVTVVNEADMIKKVYFPKIILPLYQAVSYFIDLLIALVIFLFLCLYYQWSLSWNLVWFPFFLFMTFLFSMSLSFWLSPINVRFRDIQIVIPMLLQLFFVLSPIMYPIPDNLTYESFNLLSFFYNLNPMTGLIEGFRLSLIGVGNPFTFPHLLSYLIVFLLFFSGLAFFNYSQDKFADII